MRVTPNYHTAGFPLNNLTQWLRIPVFQNSILTHVECRGGGGGGYPTNTAQLRVDIVSETLHSVCVYFPLPRSFHDRNARHLLSAAVA